MARRSRVVVTRRSPSLARFESCWTVTRRRACARLGLSSPTLLYRWMQDSVRQGGVMAVGLEVRVRELEAELRRVERERDILKKALSIFGRDG